MKRILLDAAHSLGISAAGFCRARVYDELRGILAENPTAMASGSPEERINPFLLLASAKSVMVCLFSYNCGNAGGNLSRYARAPDYHITVSNKLSKIEELLQSRGFEALSFCDTGPLCDRYLAYLAGLGFFGRNHALINPVWGSYTFIGYVLTSAEIEPDKPLGITCGECGRCERACPGKALAGGGFCEEHCASYLTQKKGELSPYEREIIKKSGFAWGCDICQEVCPYNKNARTCEIGEFDTNLITSLSSDMAASGREFKRKYKDRAFSWRGYGVILRNLEILQED